MAKKKKNKKEYSKIWVTIIMSFTLVMILLLVVLDRMETLAVALVTEIVAVFGGYMVKAYLGKRNEENNRIYEEQLNQKNDDEDMR